MSIIKAGKIQSGISITTANNFILDASADDGTCTLKRADGTNILQVDSDGNLLSLTTTSDIDDTANRLLKLGDFGLGSYSANNIADIDSTENLSGIYATSSSTNGTFPTAHKYGAVLHMRRASTDQTQLTYNNSQSLWVRRYSSTSWSDWQEVYSSGNIIGSVSQSSGVPTGSIIEEGSNSNGTYIKFADGTMICTGIGTMPSSAVSAMTSFTKDWASSFIDVPIISWSVSNASVGSGSVAGAGEIYRNGLYTTLSTSTQCKMNIYTYVENIGYDNEIDYIGIGRWFS